MRLPLRKIATGLWIAVFVLGGTLLLGAYRSGAFESAPQDVGQGPGIGGPFSMTDVDRGPVTEADFEGRPMALFFGFTSCPDVCPTMLYQMSTWLDELGPLAERIEPIFVSVDPERDTADIVSQYLDHFDERIKGLVGTPEQLSAFASNYGVYYEKEPLEGGGYTMNHTAGILLFNRDGDFQGTTDYHEAPEDAFAKLRRLAEKA